MRKTATGAAVLAVTAVLALTGCETTSGTAGPVPTTTSAAETTKPAAEPTPTQSSTLAWGQTYTYTDGLAVTVAQPTAFTPTEYAAITGTFPAYVIVNITVVNGTADPFDLTLFSVDAQSAGAPGGAVYDTGNKTPVGGNPSSKVLPGATITWPVAFGVGDPADITLDVSPGFNADMSGRYDDLFWKGASA